MIMNPTPPLGHHNTSVLFTSPQPLYSNNMFQERLDLAFTNMEQQTALLSGC